MAPRVISSVNMKSKLKRFYAKEQFNPGFLGLLVNPFYFARKGLHKNISQLAGQLNGRLLDIGCGTKPYSQLCAVEEYIGLEIDDDGDRILDHADVSYSGDVIPFEDKFFDSLISNQVFEHVFNPEQFLDEANRVLKVDGLFLISVPFVWDEHEQPYDFARYSSFGLSHVLKKSGFKILELRKSSNGIEVVFQLLNAYLHKILLSKNGYLNLLLTIVLLSPINILGFVLSKIMPVNHDLYLDNVVLAKKVHDL